MTPEELTVIEAARQWHLHPSDSRSRALAEAVEALNQRSARPAGETAHEESERAWAEVVEGDQIFSAKTKRWYEVHRSVVNEAAGTIKLNIKGSAAPLTRPLAEKTVIRRGVSGDAVDVFRMLWSAPYDLFGKHRADSPAQQAGPMLGDQEES